MILSSKKIGIPPKSGRGGFSILEILLAMVLLSIILFSFLWMQRHSQFSTMDAYYEGLALSLAREPITLFKAFGYDWVQEYTSGKADLNQHFLLQGCPLGQWYAMDQIQSSYYPTEAGDFERRILVDAVTEDDGRKCFLIRVEVAPKGHSQVDKWLSRETLAQEGQVFEERQ